MICNFSNTMCDELIKSNPTCEVVIFLDKNLPFCSTECKYTFLKNTIKQGNKKK